ncbi:alpha/beta hydrolase family protein [Streptomyces sp. 4N124]|uniref:alpha/beta hydrolase family protein n=1 Tax=Streptomyces sp. 4N124 TaxID=3457420 RepID=UPI003FD0E082
MTTSPTAQDRTFPLGFRIALSRRKGLSMLGLRRREPLLPRLLFMGADAGEAVEALRAVDSPRAWVSTWCALAARHTDLGERYRAGGDAASAAESYQQAAVYLRIAEYLETSDTRRSELWRKLVATASRAGALLNPPLLRLDIPWDGLSLPVALRIPSYEDQGPVPCVLTLGGVDGVKEEFHGITEAYLRRGWASAAMDLPGQGELRRLHGVTWRPDAEGAVSAVLDELCRHPGIDPARIAVVGGSAGGYFALRAAGTDPRIAACGLISAPVGLLDVFRGAPPPIPQTIAYNLGATSRTAVERALRDFTAEEHLPAVRCPVWQVAGGADTTVRPHHARTIEQRLHAPQTTTLYPDGDHMCFNHRPEWEGGLRNWLAEVLGAGRGVAEGADVPAGPGEGRGVRGDGVVVGDPHVDPRA